MLNVQAQKHRSDAHLVRQALILELRHVWLLDVGAHVCRAQLAQPLRHERTQLAVRLCVPDRLGRLDRALERLDELELVRHTQQRHHRR